MATLYKRGKTYWAQVYANGKRQRISLQTDNHGIARSKVRKMEYDLEQGGLQLPTRTEPGPLLSKFVAYRNAQGRAGSKSVQTDIYRLREFFGPICPELQVNSRARKTPARAAGRQRRNSDISITLPHIEDLTTATVTDFLTRLRNERDLAPKTANEYREILHRFMNWAIECQGVRLPGEPRRNPVADVPAFRTDLPEISYLTLEQVHRQLEALADQPAIQVLVAVYIYAGLRREEALWLTHEDVDLDRNVIHVRRKTVDGRSWQSKTGVNRTVPISRALRAYLETWQPDADQPWYFPSPGGMQWDPDNFSSALSRLNERAGLPWGCLDFRHTFGSHLAQRGESLYKISKLMGNSPEICRRHYAALSPECLEGCVDFDEAADARRQTPDAPL